MYLPNGRVSSLLLQAKTISFNGYAKSLVQPRLLLKSSNLNIEDSISPGDEVAVCILSTNLNVS